MDFIITNKTEIIAVLGSVVTVASIIVKMTPNPKDDAILAKVMKVLNVLALNPKK